MILYVRYYSLMKKILLDALEASRVEIYEISSALDTRMEFAQH